MRLMLAIALLLTLFPSSAVIIPANVVQVHPDATPAYFVWDFTYSVNSSLVIYDTYFVLGGIKCKPDATTKITVVVHEWKPSAIDAEGETVLDFSVIGDQPGRFTLEFSLSPNKYYTIYRNGEKWKDVKSDNDGWITISDIVASEKRYTVECKKREEAPIPFIPPEEEKKGIPGLEAVFAIAGLIITAYLLSKKY